MADIYVVDIVERLRAPMVSVKPGSYTIRSGQSVMDEAADEIVRLRAQVATAMKTADEALAAARSSIRAEALLEAAKVAETCFVHWPMDGREQRHSCARAIRALIPKP